MHLSLEKPCKIHSLSFEKGLVAFVGFVKGYKQKAGEGQLFHAPNP